MKARQKLMSLLGVTLLLASTILTPISTVVAQTQNSTQTSQTTSGSKEVSKEQAQQSSSTTNTGDKSKQSPKGAESSKSNKTEEKSETQPGAPPRSKRTRRAAPAGALDVKEVDNVITDLQIKDANGNPLNHALKKWENFRITGKFKLPDNVVKAGDHTTIQLPNKITFWDDKGFDLKDSTGQVVAHATVDPKTKTITLKYTDYAQKHSGVTGSFFFYARVDHSVVKTKQTVSVDLTINKRAIAVGKVDFEGLPPAEKTDITKSGWIDAGKVLHYQIPVNRSGISIPNASVYDHLPNNSLQYVQGTLKIEKGTWTPDGDKWEFKNRVDVTSQFKSKITWTETSFNLQLGNLSSTDGYYITYDVKANYTPVDGEKFVNNAKLYSNGQVKKEVSFTNSYFEGGGQAEGYVYNIKIHKKDEQGKPLKGAEFQVIRDRTKQVIKTVTTDNNGNAEITGLLKDTYTIKETKAPEGYQLSTEEIKVKPEDFGATKSVTKDIINKKNEKVSAQLQVKKELIGRQLKDKEFTFELKRKSDKHLEDTVKNDRDGLVKFKELTFTEVGTYEYIISEKREDHPEHGLFYDISDIDVTVTVGRDNEGKLAVTKISYKEQGSSTEKKTFTNTYTPDKTETRLSVNKKLTGRSLREGEFQFELKKEGELTPIQTKSNGVDGKVQFDSIEYDKAGTYNYTITEKAGNVPGVVYEPNLISATVVVEDKGGKLEVTKVTYSKAGLETKDPTFINQYTPGKTFAKLQVNKILTGRDLQNGEFEFELTGTEDHKHQVKTNDANGKVEFDQIEYTKAGEYHYTITEKKGQLGGITYDTKEVKATVKITDDGKGQLHSEIFYDNNDTTFNNKYSSKKTSAAFDVTKVLTGRNLKDQEFEFELKNDATGAVEDTAKNNTAGKVQFKTLEYDKAGVYKYTITEKNNKLGGVTYDNTEIKVTVTVTDDGKGNLVAKVEYANDKRTFNNTYTTQATSATFDVTKELTGRKLKAQEFEFELKEDGKSGVLQTAKNDAQGKVQFQAITYDKAGDYHYTITEKNNGLTGVTYDSSKVKVTVKVTDDGKGKLSTTVTYDGGKKTFKNTFTPKEITVPLKVTKALTGRNLQDDEFEFELYDVRNNLLETVKNKADGTIPFTALKFTKAGRYNYTIKEKDGKVSGVDYDKQPIKVTISVQQEEDGQLVVNVIYLGLDESGKNQISKQSFTNKYTAKGTEATFSVTKKLTGRALKDGEFSFDLKEDGKADVLQTKKNDKDGKVQFDAIKYSAVGTHHYTITEKNTGLGGVTYDTKTIKVTVEVTDDGKGQLVSKVTYENNDQTFNNTYSSQKVSAQLSVTKELTGRALNDQEFEFELVGSDDNVRQTKKNAADGRVTFDAIDYTKVGTYHYTIKEKDNGLGGVTYDKKEIKATVKVTDDGNGQLVAQVSYDTANPTFRNTYLAKETTATLEANKVLTGRELKANEFAFDLIDPNGEVVDTAKNAKDGKISFKELTFKTAGTYTYTIKEQAGALGGVKYDTKVIKATVTVTDDGKGQLHATVAYENNQNTFTNTYSADKATATLSAKKLLEGRNLKEGEFEFELTGTDDQVRQTKTNAQDGSVTFDTIEYTKVGTYHYTITEKDTKLGGVKYDTKVIKATVTVTDDGQGHLVTKVAYEKDDQTFKNTYSAAKTNAQLSVKKALTGRALKDGEFEFELKEDSQKEILQSKKNAQDGSVTFDTIEYTKAGTYHYTIKEKDNNLGGVKYDTKVIKATVTVTDNGQGQLVAQVAYEQNDQTFTNQYQAAPTTAQLSANKQLTGRDLKAGEFSFELKNDKDEVLETVTNDKDGKITFKTLTYTAVGTYQYTITEKDTKLGGVKYDTKVIKATVTVTDNGAGKLVATVSYDTKDRVFNNTYTPDPVPATIGVTKKLIGRALKANEFEFVLKDEKGRVLQTKKNAADGSVNFDALEYNTTGTYHYTIAEKNTKLQGITYDKKVIKVTVTVTDDANGHLVAKVSYDKNIKTFENRYTPPKKGLPKTGTVIHTLAIFIGLIVLAGAVYLMKKKS
ncbi:Spy0128 family protein [Streptococcus intermedius]|uniref:Spy0128 family protein n=1 Tax=Streptococcus intermedius TaxID=1338 RepID=UPI000C8254CB|nr:FctA domain-containing protein [Streptococcus intermedius]PMR63961.1 pilus assembly protein [Streptococcus intermedius]WOI92088.1 FctA domain-containing protein [Streptococcus intermedius]